MRGAERRQLGTVSLLGALLFMGCRSESPGTGRGRDVPSLVGDAVLQEPRAEIVARADHLATLAEKADTSNKAPLLVEAAQLRERIWRLERHKVDALEAIELYSDAGRAGDCAAYVHGVALRAEVDVDPGIANTGSVAQTRSATEPRALVPVACELPLMALRSVLGVIGPRNSGPGSLVPGSLVPGTPTQSQAGEVGGKDRVASRDGTDLVNPVLPSGKPLSVPVVEAVERYGAKDSARIVVRLSEPTTYRAGLLRPEDVSTGARLYVDIDRATFTQTIPYPVGGLVQGIRMARQSEGVRLVLDLEEAANRRIFYMPEPFRLVIDIARGTGKDGLVQRAPRVIERVVIDPGHGGNDPGAIGPRGLREKDVTLDIAHRTAPLIARELGLSTLLTRDTDTYVALDERTARANAFRADLFISIHCNAAEKTGSDGVVTFVLDTTGDLAASRVAAIENAASANAAKELANALGPSQDEGVLSRSYHFAELLQKSTVASLSRDYGKIPNQGVRRAGFYVLAGAHMPAALYEVSFISNPEGEVRLNTADYRQRLADSIVNAVRAYRDGL